MAVRFDLERAPRTRNKLIGLLADGLTVEAAAQAMATPSLKVSAPAVWQFAQRHKDEIEALRQTIAKSVEDFAIARKVERVSAMQDRWERMHTVIRERAAAYESSGAGTRSGLLVHEYKETKDGRLLDQWKVDTGLLAEFRALERAAAEELGQIERPAITNNVQVNQFLVREYGIDNPESV